MVYVTWMGKWTPRKRAIQAHKLVSIATGIVENNDPLIVCGDFNVTPNSETLKILSQAGLTDLVTTRATKGTRTSYYKKAQ